MAERPRILIVDDDESTCRSLDLIFRKKGYETETAGTGREAMELVRKSFFHVALLDIKLPDTEGVLLLRPFKELRPDMVMIMVTGHSSLETTMCALNEGASAYITKPLNMNEVLASIEKILERQHLVMENRRLYEAVQEELRERKHAEESLEESEERFRDLYENAPIAYFSVGADGIIHRCNRLAG
ncbi:MAG: response regulator [Candidatus Latescibacterota bacterium]